MPKYWQTGCARKKCDFRSRRINNKFFSRVSRKRDAAKRRDFGRHLRTPFGCRRFLPLRAPFKGSRISMRAHSPSSRKPYGKLSAPAQKRGFACANIHFHEKCFKPIKHFSVIFEDNPDGRLRFASVISSLRDFLRDFPAFFACRQNKKSLYRGDIRTCMRIRQAV